MRSPIKGRITLTRVQFPNPPGISLPPAKKYARESRHWALYVNPKISIVRQAQHSGW